MAEPALSLSSAASEALVIGFDLFNMSLGVTEDGLTRLEPRELTPGDSADLFTTGGAGLGGLYDDPACKRRYFAFRLNGRGFEGYLR